MKFWKIATLSFLMLTASFGTAKAQFIFGNTGLMHLPTADMQKDKTFMTGWNWLSNKAIPQSNNYGWAKEPTMNYYADITILPWMEVSYTCTLIRGKYLAAWRDMDPSYFKYWANQDRHFDFRFRLWKEGWWKDWTPQIVLGLNDALHTFSLASAGNIGLSDNINGFWGRIYIAGTKHLNINSVGTAGLHLAYLYNNRKDFHFKGLGAGLDFRFDKIQTGSNIADNLIHGISILAEYDTRTFNAGAQYSLPALLNEDGSERVSVHLICEMLAMKDFSGGVCVKLHLR